MELTAATIQTVQAGQDILFQTTAVRGNCNILHREGSGLVTLRNVCNSNNCKTLYNVEFSGNIAVAEGGTAGPISLSIAVNGEALSASKAIVTPAAVGDYFNVFVPAQIYVSKCCCVEISVQNTSGVPIDVQNANLLVNRA